MEMVFSLRSGASFFQISHGIHKGATQNRHDQIDGIKVFFAIEASGQVGVWVDGRMIIAANGAAEPGDTGCPSHVQSQHLCDDGIHRDVISDCL
jgi:hypothetical protein